MKWIVAAAVMVGTVSVAQAGGVSFDKANCTISVRGDLSIHVVDEFDKVVARAILDKICPSIREVQLVSNGGQEVAGIALGGRHGARRPTTSS